MAAAPTTLSSEAAELASSHQLGALEGTFTPKRLNKALFALYIFTTLNLLVMFVIPGLLFLWWLRRTPDFSRRQAAKRLHLFENGMIVHPESGDGTVVIRWDSVRLYQDITRKVINGIPGPTEYAYSAVGPDRAGARITHFYEDPESWGPHMQQAVLRAQGPAVLQSVLAGETVNLGDISLSRTGLTARGKGHLPWSGVQEIQVAAGRVHVMGTGGSGQWCSVAVSDIANLHVFLAVAQHLAAPGPSV
ncbi:hypothetical protein GCM10015535_57970 [Streptomyces gelaticus]|uniref:PH domain-containing protein n=1 Tax=Streptomyces gelaticus TaxID=285446 RepID=A0ABQ2W613_9ACTN|nr:DUF6585 family protein [Streptomyces gelaticus]GGV93956.1 hypothetical protein GCM10015535_57970 [Streptomyces gelaticus]